MRINSLSKSEFRVKLFEIIRNIESSNERIIITDNGKPVLEVRPVRDDKRKPLDILRGSLIRFDDPTKSINIDD